MHELPRCDTVIALWGRTAGTPEHLADNTVLAHVARDIARARGARRVLHFSSMAVYGPGTDWKETDAPAPAADYARAKRAMEQAVAEFADDGIAHCCLRMGNLAGADSLAAAMSGRARVTLDRFAEGTGPERSYLCPADLARALAALAALPHEALPGLLNLAAPTPVAMENILEAADQSFAWRPAPDGAVQRLTMDTTRLRGLLPGLELSSEPADIAAAMHAAGGAG
ncbi:NAD-dependent epimerase/dehydratase family protein [Roseovarius salinarum]|uniref:NAD-dependent epimerase/dehydratase family protein n=1 Tax=Roseovarius salinarum TaxID=1981892 RepID=UPI001E46F21C|nr:NAD-dependent epimerase/dehydratase family protein [Roseovarius salinarum]